MGIATRRKVHKTGAYTSAITLPAALRIGKIATMACDRIIIVDPRGEIHEDDLLDFLEEEVEPRFWPWLKNLNKGEAPTA
ncbi:MAG: hypothetical protein NWF14_00370 [Candidatus Bathyarchaeota archaeon]|nr:hypothetical protein [Candidatus Bathyarchaeota archaeon]